MTKEGFIAHQRQNDVINAGAEAYLRENYPPDMIRGCRVTGVEIDGRLKNCVYIYLIHIVSEAPSRASVHLDLFLSYIPHSLPAAVPAQVPSGPRPDNWAQGEAERLLAGVPPYNPQGERVRRG